jgi:hypothetical protein
MTFHRRAWHAAAAEYGRQRAEKYGRIARVRLVVACILGAGLLLLIVLAAQGGFGG